MEMSECLLKYCKSGKDLETTVVCAIKMRDLYRSLRLDDLEMMIRAHQEVVEALAKSSRPEEYIAEMPEYISLLEQRHGRNSLRVAKNL